ncbi:MAG: sulfotransferase [Dokdonella sp.]|uniref:tetratricopeptide repeat-containing sulfotransferase family protein n=1 Tax=Dokdonella sp. TaxID=2291710 RepID=UPI003F7DEE62
MSGRSLHPDRRFAGLPIHLTVSAEQAQRALERGDAARALREIGRALHEAPEHAELLRLQALALLQLGERAHALEVLHEAAERAPDDALISCQLGAALAQNGDMAGAEAAFRRAVAQDPGLVDAWYNLGFAFDRRGDAHGANQAYERVLALSPGNTAARVRRAEMLKMLGRLGEAEAELRAVLAIEPASVAAWVGLSNLRTFRPDDAELERLLALHASGAVPEQQRVDFDFACAALLETRGRHAEAFALFVHANAGKRRTVRWNAAAVSRLVDEIIERFGRLPPARADMQGSEAIFLVGMPRSGSTLVEQILATHPEVQGGGERSDVVPVLQAESKRRGRPFPSWIEGASDGDWRRLGEDYLARCHAWRDARPRFTDKTLANWQTLAAIRRMLPGARVVHCRRDPLETLWSCYKHHFSDAQSFTYDLDELVAFWRDCERTMQAWSLQFPGWIHPFIHEELLREPEAAIRSLTDALQLPFDAACLAFHRNDRVVQTSSASQVRQPLRRDLAVAHRYGDLLEPLRQRMAAALRGVAS